MLEEYENYLEHVGVLGMKWGRRKARGSSGPPSTPKVRKHAPSSDYKESRELKKKGVKALSTAELKKLNERLQLENTYKALTPAKISKGRKKFKQLVEDIGTLNKAFEISEKGLGKAVKTILVAGVKAAAKG